MTKLSGALVVLFATLLGVTLYAAPAQALLFKTFVSAGGSDANNCDLGTPCATMSRAISQTASGGMVSCLDSKNYSEGSVAITVSMTIDCGGTTAAGGPFTVNGAGISVVIKNIFIFETLFPGIDFVQGASLTVENVLISHIFHGGILIEASGPVGSVPRFVIRNSTIHDNSGGAESGGIVFKPTAAGFLFGEITDSTIAHNNYGVIVDGQAGVSAMVLTLQRTSLVNNTNDGLIVGSAGAAAFVQVERSTLSHNGGSGIAVGGAGALVRVSGSSITGNATGVNGNVESFLNNVVTANGVDGSMSAAPGGLR